MRGGIIFGGGGGDAANGNEESMEGVGRQEEVQAGFVVFVGKDLVTGIERIVDIQFILELEIVIAAGCAARKYTAGTIKGFQAP